MTFDLILTAFFLKVPTDYKIVDTQGKSLYKKNETTFWNSPTGKLVYFGRLLNNFLASSRPILDPSLW